MRSEKEKEKLIIIAYLRKKIVKLQAGKKIKPYTLIDKPKLLK